MTNRPKVKICGIKSAEEINYLNRYQPDYMGFIFAKSTRQISREDAKRLKKQLSESILSVGVFVNAPIEEIISICDDKTIDFIQLHGDEEQETIDLLKKEVPQKIIKAVRVKDTDDIKKALFNQVDFLLLDSYVKKQYGGSGKTFDYHLIPGKMPDYFLAGGLNFENVENAISICNPYCVDLNSGVETYGKKDEIKIIQILNLIKKNME